MEINIGLVELLIGALTLVLGFFGIGQFKKNKDSEKVENAHESVGASKANDSDRDESINRANEVIQKNLKAIKDAKNILDSNDTDK